MVGGRFWLWGLPLDALAVEEDPTEKLMCVFLAGLEQ